VERIAVIADVHADWRALKSVALEIERRGIDRVWCLGDWVSGGPQPKRAFDWVLSNCEQILIGNHELFVTARAWERRNVVNGEINAAATAFRELGRRRVDRLYGFDAYALTDHAELVHGALTAPADDFVSSRAQAELNLSLLKRPLLLFAHTHQPALWEPAARPGALKRRIRVEADYELALSTAKADRRLLNPGAVCDPDGARWLELTFDGDRSRVTAAWHRTGVPGHGRPNGAHRADPRRGVRTPVAGTRDAALEARPGDGFAGPPAGSRRPRSTSGFQPGI
jgi:predicted phosphodiesterase